MAFDLSNAQELFPNQSVTGTLSPPTAAMFKVFANRSLVQPETLVITLEASGGAFPSGSMAVFDPHQLLLDERTTRYAGEVNASQFIVPETGYYLIMVNSNQPYSWSLTVNWSVSAASPVDNDNDLSNATVLPGPSGGTADNLTDWTDLVDVFAINLTVHGQSADTILFNLTSPGTADLDLYLFHLEGGLAVLDSFSNSPTGTEYAAFVATANRTYYLWVMSYEGSSPYSLEWVVLDEVADDNGSPATATRVGTTNMTNSLARWDLMDVFRLDVPANTTVNISSQTIGYNASSREPNLDMDITFGPFTRVSWSFSFDPREHIDVFLAREGTYYLWVYAFDNVYFLARNLTFSYTLDIRVDPPPALANPAWTGAFVEDETGTLDLSVLIPPDPSGEHVSYRVTGANANVIAVLAADGRTLTVSPEADWSGGGTVWVEASDRWQSVTIGLSIWWAAVNDAPRLREPVVSFAMDEDMPADLDFSASMVDPEGDALNVTGVEAEPPLSAEPIAGGLRLSAPPNYHGALALKLTVRDSLGATAVLSIPVLIRSINDAPVFQQPVGPFAIDEDADAANASFEIEGMATDPDGDPVVYSAPPAGPVGILVLNGTMTLYPERDFSGTIEASLYASDGLVSTSIRFSIQVRPVNDAPRLELPSGQRIARENESYALRVDAVDPDTAFADLRYSFFLDGTLVAAQSTSPEVALSFSFEDGGYHVVRVVVTDGQLTAGADIALFVAGADRPPVATILTPREGRFRLGEVVAFSARASDPDGRPVNLSWIVDGRLVSTAPTFSLDDLAQGAHSVVLLVSDGEGTVLDESSFTVDGSAPGMDAAGLLLAVGAAVVIRRIRPPRFSVNAPIKFK